MDKIEYLKKFSKEERRLQTEIAETQQTITELAQKRQELGIKLKQVQVRIQVLKRDRPHVTEHAVYRYMQRVLNTSTEALQEEMMTPMALKLLDEMGWSDGKYPSGKGYSLVVKDGVVVTVEV